MPESLGRIIGLLRTLEWRPLPFERLTEELLRREGLGRVREKAGGIISIRMPGHHAFTELTDCLLDRLPAIQRGTAYADIQTELFNFIEGYVGRDHQKDAEALVGHFEKWFADRTSPRRVFVPCLILMRGGERRRSAPCRKPAVTSVRAGHAKNRE